MPNLIEISELPDATEEYGGFPHLKWDVVQSWIEQNCAPADQTPAAVQAVNQWLGEMVTRIPGEYTVVRSIRFLLMVEPRGLDVDPFLRHLEHAESIIQDHLEGLYFHEEGTRIPLLWFTSIDDYRTYLSYYFRENLPRRASGYCIRKPPVHIAMWGDEQTHRRVLPHELARAFLRPEDLPAWLEEGIAAIMTSVVHDKKAETLSKSDKTSLRAFYESEEGHGIADGTSFFASRDGFRYSHQLAEALTRHIHGELEDEFEHFCDLATAEDNGEIALQDYAKMSFDDLVQAVLKVD